MASKYENKFDKIMKENITSVSLPFIERLLRTRLENTKELKDRLQITTESEPDFLRIVEAANNDRFILHLEFQSNDDPEMIDRMGLYFFMLKIKYQLLSKQYVLYLGKKPSKMRNDFIIR